MQAVKGDPAVTQHGITIVHTRRGLLLTKKLYADWRAVQDDFDDYVSSLGPFSHFSLVEYLGIEYPSHQPFSDSAINDFVGSNNVDLWETSSTHASSVTGAVRRFEEAAIEWAATGYGKPLIDAAVTALVEGLDTPSLRILAGSTARSADEEAAEHAADTFDEIGLNVPEKQSADAYVALAKLKAERFLETGGHAPQLATDLYMLWVKSEYRSELGEFADLDDWYVTLDGRANAGASSTVDDAVRQSAERLVAGLPSRGRRLGNPYMAEAAGTSAARGERIRKWLGFKDRTV